MKINKKTKLALKRATLAYRRSKGVASMTTAGRQSKPRLGAVQLEIDLGVRVVQKDLRLSRVERIMGKVLSKVWSCPVFVQLNTDWSKAKITGAGIDGKPYTFTVRLSDD